MSEIILKPLYGLCNRIQSINSTLVLAKKLRKNLTVLWEQTHYLNCSFKDIFRDSTDFNVIELSSFNINSSGIIENDYYNITSPSDFQILSETNKKIISLEKSCDKVLYQDEIDELLKDNFPFEKLSEFKKI